MANIAIFRINYKSDFILTLNSDAGWMTPFCIKFWTGAPSQAYFVGYDGTTYTHCAPVAGDPTKLRVKFDDHHLPIGDLKFQIGYHFTVADFPTAVEDEVINQAAVIIDQDGTPMQVMLDLNGETAPEIQFSLPAYANEAQRIANEEQRIAHEATRIVNEESRIVAETIRQQNETQRINNEAQRIRNEEARIAEFAQMKAEAIEATGAANDAAALANQKAQLAADKAALAQAASYLANAKAQLAADKAALADAAATLANQKAALAQQKAEYAQEQGTYSKNQGDYAKEQGDYSKAQGDYAKDQGDYSKSKGDYAKYQGDYSKQQGNYAKEQGDICAADHQTAVADHQTATADHQTATADHQTATTDHTQAGNDHTRAESDHTRAESDHAAVEVYVDSLGAFDISAYHATGGVLAKYADLAAALGTNGANIPDALRKGGMSVKFVQSSDNNYVQYRYMETDVTTAATFTNTENWQGVEEKPKIDSKNLVKSGGIATSISEAKSSIIDVLNRDIDHDKSATESSIVLQSDDNVDIIEVRKESTKVLNDLNIYGQLKVSGSPLVKESIGIFRNYLDSDEESITLETDDGTQCGAISIGTENGSEVEPDYMDAIEFGDTLIVTDKFTEARKPIRTNGIFKWYSKKWATVGDSLVEYNSRSSKFVQEYISEDTGINIQNVGHSGWGFVGGSYITEINGITTPDVITIQSSGNDMGILRNGLPLGNITDNTNVSYCGYINQTLDRVFELFPTVPLGCITSPPWKNGYPGGEDKLFENMCNAFMEICYNRGIPTLDLFHSSNLHPENIHYRALVYSKDEKCVITTSSDPTAILVTSENIDDLQVLSNDELHVGDYVTNAGGVHPNEIGHALMAPRVKHFLEKLILL